MIFLLIASQRTQAQQTWSWSVEEVDISGLQSSIVTDGDGNVHLVYSEPATNLKYGYRPAGQSSKWFTMALKGSGSFTGITLDRNGYAHICATARRMSYGYFDGKQWTPINEIAADAAAIGYSCSLAIDKNDVPHLAWYKEKNEDGSYFLHSKYASLEDGVWVLHTIDTGPQDGKWNSMIIDPKGTIWVAYDEFVTGMMKIARKDGDKWLPQVVEARTQNGDYNIGMGNSMALDAQGRIVLAYYTSSSIHFSRQQGNVWSKPEFVASITSFGGWVNYRSSIAVDRAGSVHIVYDDYGAIRHAYWDGQRWQNQLIVRNGHERDRYPSMAMDKSDNIYISYRDPQDGSMKVAVGRPRALTPAAENNGSRPKP
jgi:hypothetical protein